jgi:hypothetical protein
MPRSPRWRYKALSIAYDRDRRRLASSFMRQRPAQRVGKGSGRRRDPGTVTACGDRSGISGASCVQIVCATQYVQQWDNT